MNIFDPKLLKQILKQYRHDVPSVGTVTREAVDQLLAVGRICRGWTTFDGKRQYFHIIKSPGSYPDKSAFFGDSETEVLEMTVHLGMQHEIDLENLLKD
jgi:hypothetical protein